MYSYHVYEVLYDNILYTRGKPKKSYIGKVFENFLVDIQYYQSCKSKLLNKEKVFFEFMLSSRVFFPLDIICWIVRSRTYNIIVITNIIDNTSTFRCVTLCRKKGSANSEKGIICQELSLSFHGFLKIVGTVFPFFISSNSGNLLARRESKPNTVWLRKV